MLIVLETKREEKLHTNKHSHAWGAGGPHFLSEQRKQAFMNRFSRTCYLLDRVGGKKVSIQPDSLSESTTVSRTPAAPHGGACCTRARTGLHLNSSLRELFIYQLIKIK